MYFLVFTLTILLSNTVNSNPCSKIESLDITAGRVFENGSALHNGNEYTSGSWYEEELDNQTMRFGCPCIERICLWKCCDERQMFFSKTCTDTELAGVNPFMPTVYNGSHPLGIDATELFFYMHNQWLCKTRYLVDPLFGYELYLQGNATLFEVNGGDMQWHTATSFCMDMMATNETQDARLVALVCHPEDTPDDDSALYIAYAIGLLLSVPFLLATFLVYAFIPELRNLHGLCLMAYCSGLIVAYPLLAYLKLLVTNISITYTGCMVLGFIVYYSFQTSFFWLNVMCFDIWRTFSGYRGGGGNKHLDRKRFFIYGAYAWGVPLALTSVVIGMQYSDDLPSNVIRPGFGDRRCWFKDWLSELVYFFTPVLVLVVCNVIFFTVTAYRIRSIRQETAILKSSESSRSDKLKRDKQRYALYLKLFVVMGVNWTVEVISFGAGGTNWYWIVVDISNIGLGIFIFFIFVWKNRVRSLVRKNCLTQCFVDVGTCILTMVSACWSRVGHFFRSQDIYRFASWRGYPEEGTSGRSDMDSQGTGRWATRSSTAATEVTRVYSSEDPGVRLKDMR